MPPESAERSDLSAPYFLLPEAPATESGPVRVWEQDVEILTYAPGVPERNPMFLERRVYQGSSGRVYPLPFIDRIAIEPLGVRFIKGYDDPLQVFVVTRSNVSRSHSQQQKARRPVAAAADEAPTSDQDREGAQS